MTDGALDRTTITGLITIGVLTTVFGLVFSGNFGAVFGGSPDREVVAEFRTAAQLRSGDPVRIGGVDVGEVKSVSPLADGSGSAVRMALESDKSQLHRDARASIRWRTLLGAAFYVALDRGTKASGALGDSAIPAKNTTTQVELDDITTVVRGGAKRGLQRLPGELADAFDEPGVASSTLDTVQELSPEVRRAARALRGVDEDRDLTRLLDGTEKTVRALASRDGELRSLVQDAAATLQTTAANRDALQTSLRESPAFMRDTDVTLAQLRRTLDLADPIVDRLDRAAPKVDAALSRLRPTVSDVDVLLQKARPLLRDLRPTVRSLEGFSRRGLPVLDELTPTVERLDKTVLPGLARKWPETGISSTVMAGAALAGLSGIAAQKDENGHFVRFPLTAGSGTFLLPCNAFPGNPDFTPQQQVQCQAVSKTLDQILSYQPLKPQPGSEGTPAPSTRRNGR